MSEFKTMTCKLSILLLVLVQLFAAPVHCQGGPREDFTANDKDLVAFALNLEYFEAEFFLFGAYGFGLDKQAPNFPAGGPPPIGGQKAVLDETAFELVAQMALQEVGHIRIIKDSIGTVSFPRPQLDISSKTWAKTIDSALNTTLDPPFDPYANSINYLLASYAIPYVGLTGYTGAAPLLMGSGAKSLVSRLLGVESGQDAIIRTWLYERKNETVVPYDFTVADASVGISKLRNDLSQQGLAVVEGHEVPYMVDDEGLVVPENLGAENQTTGNVLSADLNSLSYQRTPEQILSIVYGSGSPKVPGGFYPEGARGNKAEKYHKYGG